MDKKISTSTAIDVPVTSATTDVLHKYNTICGAESQGNTGILPRFILDKVIKNRTGRWEQREQNEGFAKGIL